MTFVRVLIALSLLTALACERPVPPSMQVKEELKKAKAAAKPAEPTPEPKVAEAKPAEPAPAPAAEEPAAEEPAAVAISEEAQKAAKMKWDTLCATCHGASGKGDGPVGAALNPKPRSFADAKWQKETSDAYLAKVILGGGVAVGKSPLMPANVDLNGKDDVVAALVKMIRDAGK